VLLDTLHLTIKPFPNLRHPLDTLKHPTTHPYSLKLPENEKEMPISDFKALNPNYRTIYLLTRLISVLKLSYTPDEWQVHLIRRILQGYDSIFCAGTGYGKSLIFKGLAVLGGLKKLVIVISPLIALERDQVIKSSFLVINTLNLSFKAEHATEKGIDAVVTSPL
jgi:ATP-dependent helicase YprA (DUF1998 family)